MSHFYLRTSPNAEVKIIISVSKKVAKKAVVRNLIKRRIRAVVYKMSLKPAKYLILARNGAEKVKGLELQSELQTLMKIKS